MRDRRIAGRQLGDERIRDGCYGRGCVTGGIDRLIDQSRFTSQLRPGS